MKEISLIEHIKNLLEKGKIQQSLEFARNIYPKNDIFSLFISEYSQLQVTMAIEAFPSKETQTRINSISMRLINALENVPTDEKIELIAIPNDISFGNNQTQTNLITDLNAIHIFTENQPDEITNQEKEISQIEELTFWKWLSIKIEQWDWLTLFFLFIAIIGVILSIFTLSVGIFSKKQYIDLFNNFKLAGYVIHILLTLVAIRFSLTIKTKDIYLGKSSSKSYSYIDEAKKVISDFKEGFFLTWLGWFILYILLLSVRAKPQQEDPVLELIINIFRDISTLGIIMCFSTLYFKRLVVNGKYYYNAFAITTALVLLVLILTELFFQIYAYNPNITNNSSYTNQNIHFEALSLLLFSVALSLFVSRLGGRLINTPISFSILFFVYSATQVANAFLEPNNEEVIAFTYNYSLFAKAVLFLYVRWLIESGKLLLYAIRISNIIDHSKHQE